MARTNHPLVRVRKLGAIAAIGVVGIGGTGIALGATSHQTGTAFTCEGKQATVVGHATATTCSTALRATTSSPRSRATTS